MAISVIYDLSRLVTRILNATPNGIDRIDHLLAGHFLGHREFQTSALGLGFSGSRLLHEKTVRGATERVAAAWQETTEGAERSSAYETIVARLQSGPPRRGDRGARIVQSRPKRLLDVAQALLRYVPATGRSPAEAAPRAAIYVNATHFPLEWKRHVAWLDERPDVRPIFWIYDLLPIERPEWFWAKERSRHARRLDLLARRGAAAAVASSGVEAGLRAYLERAGRRNLPIFRQAPPVAAVFTKRGAPDVRLAHIPFFVVCGTIEPRKNHLLLLRLWRDFVKKFGENAPKLVVVGKRGWNCADIVLALEDETLRGHVIEVAGLSTPDYKRLLDHCRALLAPSLAEGFGLPVAEALATGTPVIASDIPAFREQAGGGVTYLDPLSESAWSKAILDKVDAAQRARAAIPQDGTNAASPSELAFFSAFDAFLRRL